MWLECRWAVNPAADLRRWRNHKPRVVVGLAVADRRVVGFGQVKEKCPAVGDLLAGSTGGRAVTKMYEQ